VDKISTQLIASDISIDKPKTIRRLRDYRMHGCSHAVRTYKSTKNKTMHGIMYSPNILSTPWEWALECVVSLPGLYIYHDIGDILCIRPPGLDTLDDDALPVRKTTHLGVELLELLTKTHPTGSYKVRTRTCELETDCFNLVRTISCSVYPRSKRYIFVDYIITALAARGRQENLFAHVTYWWLSTSAGFGIDDLGFGVCLRSSVSL
jgi:hypothetical protein